MDPCLIRTGEDGKIGARGAFRPDMAPKRYRPPSLTFTGYRTLPCSAFSERHPLEMALQER